MVPTLRRRLLRQEISRPRPDARAGDGRTGNTPCTRKVSVSATRSERIRQWASTHNISLAESEKDLMQMTKTVPHSRQAKDFAAVFAGVESPHGQIKKYYVETFEYTD